MTKKIFFILFILFFQNANALTAKEILIQVDEIRTPNESFLMKAEVSGTQDTSKTVLEISSQTNDKALVKWLEPTRDRGRKFLLDGVDSWLYVPNLKRAIRSSLNQKLTGLAAQGDICRQQWNKDYDAVIESSDNEKWVLLLKAKQKGLTYDKIRLTVGQKPLRPITAEFLTLSGKPLKIAEYKDFKEMAGRSRPSLMQIQDLFNKENSTDIKILEIKKQKFANSIFNRSNL